MAAGVGKTYRALIEADSRLEAGEDVVIGYLETHGRADTEKLAEGLERVPRRQIEYRGALLEEMDLPGILLRNPELCLIDELAHTNAPGVDHAKRYEDIEDVLDAGIDVFSTLNVQHLESLNDRIAELSGVRVRETVPDAVLGRADEVILIDLPPDALLARLRAGKIYAPEKIEPALGGFFKVENLAALREAALRQVAEEVEARRLISVVPGREDEALVTEATQAVGERLLALVEPYPGAQRLVRRAWRSAQRLSANLDLLWVKTPGTTLDEEHERSLTSLQQLASLLGATLIVEEADDVPSGVARIARERASTYILMGRARKPGPLARLRTPLPQRLMELLPGVDVRIVADRSGRKEGR
jgi:two-component system, OmpR family, sensor histidine kinase KdpD